MRNPTRRSRTIGTAKQGYGQNNRLDIPWQVGQKVFYERLGPITRQEVEVNGHLFTFLTETPNPGWQHCCSVADVARILGLLPAEQYDQLRLIVLRQPKRKETIMNPVWGRLIYSYEFQGSYYPAIILEAVNLEQPLRWRRSLSVDEQQELQRLTNDGHRVVHTARFHEVWMQADSARNTQLYRTLLHEFGHYQHYRAVVEQPKQPDEDSSAWEARWEQYTRLPTTEKERYAHTFAGKLAQRLEAAGTIPFNPLP